MASKVCSRCKKRRKLKYFNYRNKKKGTLQSRCKTCTQHSSRKHYRNNRPDYISRARKAKKRNRAVLRAYLQLHPCVDCGFADIRCLDFDHQHSKEFNVCEQAHNGISVKKLKEEIAKCEVRCRNCHAIRHEEERPGWRST